MALAVGEELGADLAEGAVVADGGHDIGQVFLGGRGIVDVVGSDVFQLQRLRQLDQGGEALIVIGAAVVVQFDEEGALGEARRVTPRDSASGLRAIAFEGAGDFAFAAAGEGDEPGCAARELVEVKQAFAFGGLALGLGDEPAEVLPAGFVGDEEGEGMVAFDGEFGAEDGLEAEGAGGLLEGDGAVDVVVVGEGEAGHAEAGGFGDEGFGRGGAAQQAVGGVGAELDVVGLGHGLFTAEA